VRSQAAPVGAFRLLVVDDCRLYRRGLCLNLRRALPELRAIEFGDGPSVLRYLETEPVDAALIGLHMPGMDGPTLGIHLLSHLPGSRIFFMSVDPDWLLWRVAEEISPGRVFDKNNDTRAMVRAFRALAERNAPIGVVREENKR
jgi:DNA-binding NarL/FixJ family response regulator